MASKLRHRIVSVGVIHDKEQGFLLLHNVKWGGYAFCMKKPKSGEDFGEVTLAALQEDSPIQLPEATVQPLDTVGAFGESGSTGEETYYEYYVYEVEPGPIHEAIASDITTKFFSYDELVSSDEVTWSTRDIARAIVEHQEVALAAVSREVDGEREYFLVYKPGYGYFFPTVRRTQTEQKAPELAIQAVRKDTSYEGELAVRWHQELGDFHDSTRFGGRQRQYLFQICAVDVTGVDLNEANNDFAVDVDAHGATQTTEGQTVGSRGYSGWFTDQELRTHEEMSPTVEIVRSTVVAACEN